MANTLVPVQMHKPTGRAKRMTSLDQYDTVFLVDDSRGMKSHWQHVESALLTLAAAVANRNGGGVGLRFLNSDEVVKKTEVGQDLKRALSKVQPKGAAVVGDGLKTLMEEYFDDVQAALKKSANDFFAKKALNVIVLTTGEFSEDPEETVGEIRPTLAKLNCYTVPEGVERRVGIQFVQLGSDPEAPQTLKTLDDQFVNEDVFDTTQWDESADPKVVYKILFGAIDDKVDEFF
ncbi:hypothetical protein EXIGLDRAFT_836361 [Exidia glandulosa HHB12029]|uniref:VWFA domain-containing protein n=1 Tax=Exidia glandulosa HHB12029 TaxID=1314781 RepID=A0A165HWP5_EXIGL|nr:hypothetical protein EXIGLDRAFT_836361 [Exidia glandulosa HHB12029]